jgi:hypothetical protein
MVVHNTKINVDSSCWQLLASTGEETKKIQREIDRVFSGYSFYPEVDWKNFGYFPPDGYQVLGAWRHPDALLFGFLLDNPFMQKFNSNLQFLIYIVGEEQEILSIEKKILNLKKGLMKDAFRTAQTLGAASRLDQMTTNRSTAVFTAILAFVTVLINAFSLYLRTLPAPELSSQFLKGLYICLLSLVYFVSLGLLILVSIICGLFLLKYAFVLLRRL